MVNKYVYEALQPIIRFKKKKKNCYQLKFVLLFNLKHTIITSIISLITKLTCQPLSAVL